MRFGNAQINRNRKFRNSGFAKLTSIQAQLSLKYTTTKTQNESRVYRIEIPAWPTQFPKE